MVSEYLFTTMLHEGIHMVLDTLALRGETDVVDVEIHHDVTEFLGLGRSCDSAGGGCSSTCGYTDARLARFSECLAGGEPAPFEHKPPDL